MSVDSAPPERTPPPAKARWTVMVLAHNEERLIKACLDSILAAEPGDDFDVFVMSNGCTDRTELIVTEYARGRPEVRLIAIPLRDKCNAWNVFIHQEVPAQCAGREIYFFMNGDVRAAPGSFSAMARTLRDNPHANAASAVPRSGRNAGRDRQRLLDRRGLFGNLYSLRGSFVERLRSASVRLPLNFEDDDGLIGAFVKWDLAPERNVLDHKRVAPCATAAFEFDSLSPLRFGDWKIYWSRILRYGRRGYEIQLLRQGLEERGISALPVDVTELYPNAASLRLKWDGIYTIFNLVVLRQMRNTKKARRDSSGTGSGERA